MAAVALAPQEDIDPLTPSSPDGETPDSENTDISATETQISDTQNDNIGTDEFSDEAENVSDEERGEAAEVDSVIGDILDGEE